MDVLAHPADAWARVARRVEAWRPLVDAAAERYQVPQALIEAVIHEESGGDPDAFPEDPARAGASFGLMQLLLPTARSLGFGGRARELFGAAVSIELGTKYLAGLIKEHWSHRAALAGYNGGPRAAWLVKHGLPAGAAGNYANVVLDLRNRYVRLHLLQLDAERGAPGQP